MKILVTAPYGFIGSQIVAELITNGFDVIGCAKNVKYAKRIFPQINMIYCDFIKDINPDVWESRLQNIDVVINCVGILNAPQKEMWRIHYDAPRALFEACQRTNVKKIIQVSALGVDKATVSFAQSKKAIDDYLFTSTVASVVLRPSLVYGTGSFGGTSFFRGLAGLPGFIPIPSTIDSQMQPIHIKDLAQAVVNLVKNDLPEKHLILNAVGCDRTTFFQIICCIRQWLGFGYAIKVKIPEMILKLTTKVGDWFKLTLNSALYQMALRNNVASEEETQRFAAILGRKPKNFQEGLAQQPSYVQDRWHARLYFLRPLLRISLGFLWLYSGLVSLFGYPHQLSFELLSQVGITSHQELFLYGASIIDILLGFFTLAGKKIVLVGLLQIIFTVIYSLLITIKLPEYWLHPFAPVAKNIPLIIATLIMMGMESKR